MASIQIPNLPAVIGLSGAELFEGVQAGSSVKISLDQIIAATRGGTPATLPIPVSLGGTGATTLTGYVQGNGTAPFTASPTIPNTDITGLGTMSTQDANAVAITGGTAALTGVSSVTVNSATTAFTINQTGAGNAFVVEDSTSPDATPFVIDATGNVGIGTSSPQTSLNVAKSSSANTISAAASVILSNQNATSGTFLSGGVFSNTYRDISTTTYSAGVWFEKQNSASQGTLSSQGAVVFGTSDNNSAGAFPAERMRIDASGNVGIGTATPNSLLHVAGGASIIGDFATNSAFFMRRAEGTIASPTQITASSILAAQSFAGLDNTSTYRDVAQIRATSDGAITSASSPGFLSFRTTPSGSIASTENMRITSAGNVGIGTITPGSVLDVVGTSATDIFHVRNGTTYFTVGVTSGGPSAVNAFQTAVGVQQLQFQTSGGTSYFGGDVGIGGSIPASNPKLSMYGGIRFLANETAAATYTGIGSIASDTVCVSTSGTERMRINASGNVTVGSSTTAITVDIGGTINMPAATTEGRVIELGTGRTGNGNSFIDFIGDATYTDYGLRIIRNSTGANANSDILHRGTGGLILNAQDAGFIRFQTSATARFDIGSAGQWGIGGATYGTAGQAFVSGGAGAAPSWTSVGTFTTVTASTSVLSTGAGGIGYATGAGVAVTQLTSRTTTTPTTGAKTTGAVTLFTTTAVVGTYFTFTVPNTAIAITDTVVVTVRGAANTYVAFVSAIVAATSFNITMASVAGTASDTPIVNFAIIKGVSA